MPRQRMSKEQRDAITRQMIIERDALVAKAESGVTLTPVEQLQYDCIISVRRRIPFIPFRNKTKSR